MGLIEKYTAPNRADDFADAIVELISAGKDAAWELTVDVSDITDADEAAKKVASEKSAFQAAARAAGYSARERERDESVAGQVSIVLTLGDKITRTRGGSDPLATTEADAVGDTAEV